MSDAFRCPIGIEMQETAKTWIRQPTLVTLPCVFEAYEHILKIDKVCLKEMPSNGTAGGHLRF